MKQGSILFLKGTIVILGMLVLSFSVFWLPALAKEAAVSNPEFTHLQYPILFGLYITAFPFFLVLYEAWRLLKYIQHNNAFSEAGVNSLGKIKKYALTISIFFMFGIVFLTFQNALHPGILIMGLVIIFAAFVITFFAAVLNELLRSALEFKSENDLTV